MRTHTQKRYAVTAQLTSDGNWDAVQHAYERLKPQFEAQYEIQFHKSNPDPVTLLFATGKSLEEMQTYILNFSHFVLEEYKAYYFENSSTLLEQST